MKKALLSIILIVICYFGYGQTTYPLTQNLGAATTLVKNPNYGGIQGGLIPYTFSDTSSANSSLTYLKWYCGALIYTTDVSAYWFRSCYGSSYRWVMLNPSGAPSSGNSWLIGGNLGLFTSPISPQSIGLRTYQGLRFLTNDIPRLYLAKDGIAAQTGSTVGIGYDPSDSNRITLFSGGSVANEWHLNGNTVGSLKTLGTIDNFGLKFITNNVQSGYIDAVTGSTSFGYQSLLNNTNSNSAFGNQALKTNTSGNGNVAFGSSALALNLTGSNNTSVGESSMPSNTIGAENVGIGNQALLSNVDGDRNVGIGEGASQNNVSGEDNIGIGYQSLLFSTGSRNIGIGANSGVYNTSENNRLYINAFNRGDILGDTTKSIIYGYQDVNAADQRLYLNSRVFMPYLTNNTSQNQLMGMISGTGEQGYVTLGSGISLSSGVLSATGSGGTVTGTGTSGNMTKWNGTSSINNSVATDDGTKVTAPLADKGGAVYNVYAYGILPNGSDMTSAMVSLLATVYAAGGGTIQFNTGTYRFNSQLPIPHSTVLLPTQPSLKIIGAGAFSAGAGSGVVIGGTILDIRLVGDSATPFIDTRGIGALEITGITFQAGANLGNTPFIKTTNTTLWIHHNAFVGFNSGASANQDAIILGGVDAVADSTVQSSFQGYGTVIDNNYFDRISAGVYGKRYCNGTVISNNTFWNKCGGAVGTAAILFDSFDAGQSDAGNVIENNLIEMPNYTYGIYFRRNVQLSTVTGNNFYDEGVGSVAGIYISANSVYNYIQEGFHSTGGGITDLSSTATIVTPEQNAYSVFPNRVKVGTELKTTNGLGTVVEKATGEQHYFETVVGAVDMYYKPSGGSFEAMAKFERNSSTARTLTLYGTGTNTYNGNGSITKYLTPAGSELVLGDASTQNFDLFNGTLYAKGAGIGISNASTTGIGWRDNTAQITGTTDLTLTRARANWLALGTSSTTGDSTGSLTLRNIISTPNTTTGTSTNSGVSITANSLTTGNGLDVRSSSYTSGNIVSIIGTGTAGITNQTGLNVDVSGALSTASQTTYGAKISNTHTGTTETNVGLEVVASGATTNKAINATGSIITTTFVSAESGYGKGGLAGASQGMSFSGTTTAVQSGTANGTVVLRDNSGNTYFTSTGLATTVNGIATYGNSQQYPYRAITALRTLDGTDYTIEVTANTFTVTLPTAVGITGRIYVVTNSGSGVTTVGTTSSQTFVNVVATPTTLTVNQYSTVMVQSNGANWLRLTSL